MVSLNYVTLILDGYYPGGGNPAPQLTQGFAQFAPNGTLTDPTDHQWSPPAPVQAVFRAAGGPPQVILLANDNANVGPSGWAWTVTFEGVPGNPAAFTFNLYFANGATQYLSQLVPLVTPPSLLAYLPLPSGTPSAGQVPVATGNGEASAWGAGGGGASLPLSGGTMQGWLAPAVVALSQSSGSVAVNAAAGNDFRLTLTASGWTIANPSNPKDGEDITFGFTQDATGGRTVLWGAAYYFGGAGAPVLSTAANVTDFVSFKYIAASGLWEYLGSTSSLALPLSGGTLTGQLTVPDLAVSGLTGATAASRYVGATASGAPASGTFAVGDFTVDQTGAIWVCTTAGSPGTWTKIGGGGGGSNGGVTATALGLAIASFRPGLTAGSNSAGNGVIFAALATAVTSTAITKLGINLQTAGATPGANANGLAVYSEAGSLLRQTGDMTTAFQGTGWVEGTLTSSLAITAGVNYYLVISASFTTAPQYTGSVNGGAGLLGLNGHYLGGFVSNAGFPASFVPSSFGTLNTPPAIYGR